MFIAENPEPNPNPLTVRQKTSKREEDPDYQDVTKREEEDPDYQDVTKREEEDPDYQGVRGMWGKRKGNRNGNGKAKMVNIRRWGKRGGRGWKRGKILRGMWGKRGLIHL